MRHHTKDKGDLGVLKAQVAVAEQGYVIFSTVSEHMPFDFVAYKDGEFKRVQVRYRSLKSNGSLEVKFRTSWADKNGNHLKQMDLDEIEVFCIFCPNTNECYFFDPKKIKGKGIVLRIEPPKNAQRKDIRWAKDYKQLPP